MNNKKILKIAVPVLMVAVIVGIYFVEQAGQAQKQESDQSLDYPLHVESVDLTSLKQHEMPIIIDFGADECDPCKAMEPVLVTMNADMQGKAIVQFADVWKNPAAAEGFPVDVIPTQFFINADGTPYMPSEELGIEFTLYHHRDTEEHIYTSHRGALTEEQMRAILADMGVQ